MLYYENKVDCIRFVQAYRIDVLIDIYTFKVYFIYMK